MTEHYLIVHQPACSNVVAVSGKYGGTARRLYQGSRAQCAGYLQALLDQGGERYLPHAQHVICEPGDCLSQHWHPRKPPETWSADCQEWGNSDSVHERAKAYSGS